MYVGPAGSENPVRNTVLQQHRCTDIPLKRAHRQSQ
jgi:hypothetical protein